MYFFTAINDKFQIYMGLDKEENEELIRYGLPIDVWFHVSDLSSAHVYLRLPEGFTIDTIPEDVLLDCAQLVKANSIEGNKKSRVKVVYTMWSNLKKRPSMDVGQVGFHEEKACKYTTVDERENAVINRLMKTRVEKPTSTAQETREAYEKAEKEKRRAAKKKEEEEERQRREQWQKEKEARSYDNIMKKEAMTSNKEVAKDAQSFEEDFM